MLRCPPSRIRITLDDIDEAKHKFVLAAAARLRPESTKTLHPRALNMKPILSSAAYELQVKNGPGRARDDALVSVTHEYVALSALHLTLDAPFHDTRPTRRSRHSIHATRRDQTITPKVRRSRSHSSGKGPSFAGGVDLVDLFPLPLERTRPFLHTKQRDPLNISLPDILPGLSQAESTDHTELRPDVRAGELADNEFGRCEPMNGEAPDKSSPPSFPRFGHELPQLPSRRSSLAWNKVNKDNTKQSSSESSDSDIGDLPTSVAGRPPLTHEAHVRESSPLEELANRLRQLAATPSSRQRPSSRLSSSSSSASPRLLSGHIFYGRSGEGVQRQCYRDLPPMPVRLVQTMRPHTREPPESLPSDCIGMDEFEKSITGQEGLSAPSPSISTLGTSPILRSTHSSTVPTVTQLPMTPHTARETEFGQRNTVNQSRPRMTPRVRIYDDGRPASMQPQTPADLRGRIHAARDPVKSVPNTRRMSSASRDPISAILPSTESRYPSLQNFPSTYDLRSRVFVSTSFETSRPTPHGVPVRGRHLPQRQSVEQENNSDAEAAVMDDERSVWMSHRVGHSAAETLEATPPGEGRFERFLR